MLLVFERLILPTHASCHVQFIMFYLCNTKLVSNDIILSCFKCLLFWLSPFYFGKGQYLKWLKSKILNPNFPYMYVTYTVDYQYIILLNNWYALCWWHIFNCLMGSLLSPRISLQTSIHLIRVASAQSTLFAICSPSVKALLITCGRKSRTRTQSVCFGRPLWATLEVFSPGPCLSPSGKALQPSYS